MKFKVHRRATEEDLQPFYRNNMFEREENIKAWVVNNGQKDMFLLIDANPNTHKAGWAYDKNYNYIGGWEWGWDVGKAIEDWEFKQKLTPNTLNTFGDLIDEL